MCFITIMQIQVILKSSEHFVNSVSVGSLNHEDWSNKEDSYRRHRSDL